ncbi:S8 family serine peptidase [Luteolibacter sp. GHJ8]|uniref:S8 family serine peptidase n=1 Tax=Luteolibacter rhizosphaerae TaxID=2989719 RepID=A0ABT3G330_9BACT|nr:S8 family serine peptidase [Luteolibacter rhizosphaerae]
MTGFFRALLCAPFIFLCAHAHAEGPARMVPNGDIQDAGWALGRLNDGGDLARTSYSYQETTNPVRLYLIDTGVKQTNGWATWFKRNPKLSIIANVRVGAGKAKAFTHGTKMLSVIAGPETGAAQGTPIQAVLYDVYEGTTEANSDTDPGNIASAVLNARSRHLSTTPRIPGVICIASGTQTPESSYTLKSSIDAAVAAGLTVVVSAGNLNKDVAEGYIPAVYGSSAGVICAGASSTTNTKYSTSNWGYPVDLYAPGENVRTIDYDTPLSGGYDTMSGTSPSAALTTAAAIIELSKNPALTPAEVESRIVGTSYPAAADFYPPPATGQAQFPSEIATLVQVEPSPEPDSDFDGSADILEVFFASNPADQNDRPASLSLAQSAGEIAVSFEVAQDQFNPADIYNLANGSKWKVQFSPDLNLWQDAAGTLSIGTAADGRIPLSFTAPLLNQKGFLRVQVIEPPPAAE